jgi:hypothetical protein
MSAEIPVFEVTVETATQSLIDLTAPPGTNLGTGADFSGKTPSSTRASTVYLVVWAGTREAFITFVPELKYPETATEPQNKIYVKQISLTGITNDGTREVLWYVEYPDYSLPLVARIPYDVLEDGLKNYAGLELYVAGYSEDEDGTVHKHEYYTYNLTLPSAVIGAGEKIYRIGIDGTVSSEPVPLDSPDFAPFAPYAEDTQKPSFLVSGTAELARSGSREFSSPSAPELPNNDWMLEASLAVYRKTARYLEVTDSGIILREPEESSPVKVLEQTQFGGDVQTYVKIQDNTVEVRASVYAYVPDSDGKRAALNVTFSSPLLNKQYTFEYIPYIGEETLTLKHLFDLALQNGGNAVKGTLQNVSAVLKWGGNELGSATGKPAYTLDEAKSQNMIVDISGSGVAFSSDYFPLKLVVNFDIAEESHSLTRGLCCVVSARPEDYTSGSELNVFLGKALERYTATGHVVIGDNEYALFRKDVSKNATDTTVWMIEPIVRQDGKLVVSEPDGGFLATHVGKGVPYSSARPVFVKQSYGYLVLTGVSDALVVQDDSGAQFKLMNPIDVFTQHLIPDVVDENGNSLVYLQDSQVQLPPLQYSTTLYVNEDEGKIYAKLTGKAFGTDSKAVVKLYNAEDGSNETTAEAVLTADSYQSLTVAVGPRSAPAIKSTKATAEVELTQGGAELESYAVHTVDNKDHTFQAQLSLDRSAEDYYTLSQDKKKATAKIELDVKRDGDYVLVSAKAPALMSAVVYVTDTDKAKQDQVKLKLSTVHPFCWFSDSAKYSELTVKFNPFGVEGKTATLKVPEPRVSVSDDFVLSVDSFGYLCKIAGVLEYQHMLKLPDLASGKKTDTFTLEQPEHGKLYPALSLADVFTELPLGDVTLKLNTGEEKKFTVAVKAVGQWPDRKYMHPIAGDNESVQCLSGGNWVLCRDAKVGDECYAIFKFKQSEYALGIGKPTVDYHFMSLKDSGGSTASLELSIIPICKAPVSVKIAYHKPVDVVSYESDAVHDKYSKSINLVDIYEVDVKATDRFGSDLLFKKFYNYGYRYGKIEVDKNTNTAEVKAVVTAETSPTVTLIAETSAGEVVLFSESGDKVVAVDRTVEIPEGASELVLIANADGTEYVLDRKVLSAVSKVAKTAKEYIPLVLAFLVSGGVVYLLSRKLRK